MSTKKDDLSKGNENLSTRKEDLSTKKGRFKYKGRYKHMKGSKISINKKDVSR